MLIPKKGCPLTIEDCDIISLKNPSNWTLQGYSKAGERTAFKVEPLNILLDAGLLPTKMPKAILLTHSHVDHTWNLPNVFGGMKTNTNEDTMMVLFPEQAYIGLTKLLEAASILSYPKLSFTEEEVWKRHSLKPVPISVGDKFTIDRATIEVLRAVHTVHSVGYGFSSEKSKLKEEFKHICQEIKKK